MINKPGRYVEKRKDKEGGTPSCPLLSIGADTDKLFMQEFCAWYVKSLKACSMYLMGHNAAVDIKLKQQQQHKRP